MLPGDINFDGTRGPFLILKALNSQLPNHIKKLGARGVMVIIVGHDDTSSILDKTDCITHSTNTLGKGINPIILPPSMGK